MHMKKLLLPLFATSLIFSLSAQEASKEEKVIKEEKPLSMSMDAGMITHKSDVECRLSQLEARVDGFKTHNPVHGDLSIDLLYWRGGGNDWAYGYTGEGEDGGFVTIQRGNLDWDPGVRVALSFSGLYDWTGGLEWTFYNNSSKIHTTKSLQPIVANMLSNDLTAKVKLEYNTVDLIFGSNFRLNHTFEFKPFFGARGAWIKRSYQIEASGMTLAHTGSPSRAASVDYKVPIKFSGYGPRLGFNASCNFGESGFSIYGTFSGSLLFGKMHTKIEVDYTSAGGGDGGGPGSITDSLHDLKANVQFLAGINYKYTFDCDTKSFFIRAAWENNYYWDFADVFSILATGDSGSFLSSYEALILNGITLGIGFEY